MTNEPETVRDRLASYDRWQRICAWMAGGIGGLILFGDLAKDSFNDAPRRRATFLTALVLAGVCIGRAYFGYLTAHQELSREQEKQPHSENRVVSASSRYPAAEQACVFAGLVLGASGAGVLLWAAWTATH